MNRIFSRRQFLAHGRTGLSSIALAAMLAGPVMAVALIFFVAHAAPVQRRQIERHGLKQVLNAALPTGILALLGTLALVALAWSGMIAIPVAVAIPAPREV